MIITTRTKGLEVPPFEFECFGSLGRNNFTMAGHKLDN